MSGYIDRDEILDILEDEICTIEQNANDSEIFGYGLVKAVKFVKEQPDADVIPVAWMRNWYKTIKSDMALILFHQMLSDYKHIHKVLAESEKEADAV